MAVGRGGWGAVEKRLRRERGVEGAGGEEGRAG